MPTREIDYVLSLASIWGAQTQVAVDVNSLNDHDHISGSYHYTDQAVDLDTEGDQKGHLDLLYKFLARYLLPPYQIINAGTHLHVEFDIREYRTAN